MDLTRSAAHRLRLYHRLQVAARLAQRAADEQLVAASGVTTAQAAVLAVLAENGATAQRAVARLLGVHESAMTQMVARLLRSGLVARNHPDHDARTWELTLTARGRVAVHRLGSAFASINTALDEAVPEAEVAGLVGHLERIAEAFDPSSN
jgi:DNA-binding MarR family transcriptional regulator